MGFAKGFGYADLPQLAQPISRAWGMAWLVAALLVTTTTAMLAFGARSYWIAGAFALLVSQAVITYSAGLKRGFEQPRIRVNNSKVAGG
jgi:hypothetical protein